MPHIVSNKAPEKQNKTKVEEDTLQVTHLKTIRKYLFFVKV